MRFGKSDFASDRLGALREVVEDTLSRGVPALTTDELSIGSDGPATSFDDLGGGNVQAGYIESAQGVNGSSDGTTDTANTRFFSVSFPSAFDTTPRVGVFRATHPNSDNPNVKEYRTSSVSTTGFDYVLINRSTSNLSNHAVYWVAVEG